MRSVRTKPAENAAVGVAVVVALVNKLTGNHLDNSETAAVIILIGLVPHAITATVDWWRNIQEDPTV